MDTMRRDMARLDRYNSRGIRKHTMYMHKSPNYVILSVAKDLLRPELRRSKILRSQAPSE